VLFEIPVLDIWAGTGARPSFSITASQKEHEIKKRLVSFFLKRKALPRDLFQKK
jgi:hypothetical protein